MTKTPEPQNMPLPCPFCGVEPQEGDSHDGTFEFGCPNMTCPATHCFTVACNLEHAIKNWNTRTATIKHYTERERVLAEGLAEARRKLSMASVMTRRMVTADNAAGRKLQGKRDQLCIRFYAENDRLETERRVLAEENALLRDALAWYAASDSQLGDRARAALAAEITSAKCHL